MHQPLEVESATAVVSVITKIYRHVSNITCS